ncbi:MAG TPA: hypothetical protein VFS43_27360 [Polyangiaceae bacterium]|nr:hypothetical protein [Polyangiaceae bacterium]
MSARRSPACWALVLALAGVGCGSVEARTVAFRAPGAPTGRADLYVGKVPERAYYEVGLVQAVGTGTGADEASVLHALRLRAQRMGCDAVVRVGVELGQTAAHAIGVCVRWSEVEAARGAPAAEKGDAPAAGEGPARGGPPAEGPAVGGAPVADEQERR